MRWQGGRRSGNIEDRRGISPAAGGIGAGGIILALIGYFVFGVPPEQTLQAVDAVGGGQQQAQKGEVGSPEDQAGAFVDVVGTSVDDVWTAVFKAKGGTYQPPAGVVLYDQATNTGCGMGQSAMGPFYCPADQRVYLDLSFWQELETKFDAQGEAARAYVIAHEIGHHVQHLTGATQKVRGGSRGADSAAVRLELQADCYAGVWVAHAPQVSGGQVALDAKDVEDGLTAAAAVGDDTIQRKTQGQVVPDAFTHGTAEQRMRWFRTGVQTGDPDACDTFSARRL